MLYSHLIRTLSGVGRTIATVAAMTLLFLMGIAAGGAIADTPTPIVAQGPNDDADGGGGGGGGSHCEYDACVELSHWVFWTKNECRPTDVATGCDLPGGGESGCTGYLCSD